MVLADILSNEALDAAYEEAAAMGDFASAQAYADEIVLRLADPGSFLYGLLGGDEFPLYQARTQFDQSNAAQDSTSASVAKVGGSIVQGAQQAAGAVASVSWTALKPVIIAASVIALAAYLMRRKA